MTSMAERIREYVRQNPGKTAREIADAVGCETANIGAMTGRGILIATGKWGYKTYTIGREPNASGVKLSRQSTRRASPAATTSESAIRREIDALDARIAEIDALRARRAALADALAILVGGDA